jgi:hypothetical protein
MVHRSYFTGRSFDGKIVRLLGADHLAPYFTAYKKQGARHYADAQKNMGADTAGAPRGVAA